MERLRGSQGLVAFCVLVAGLCASGQGGTIYVDDNAAGVGDGSSWSDAFTLLQDALAVAQSGDEIRVAQGVYKPDRDLAHPDGTRDREASFDLFEGVVLKGGFAGVDAVDPNARDVPLYETILSADLVGNDVPLSDPCDLVGEPSRADNSYHVVTAVDSEPNTVIKGFTIVGGHAEPFPSYVEIPYAAHGGGMYVVSGTLTVANCRFTRNLAGSGGALYAVRGYLDLVNCTFSDNFAQEVCVVSEGGRDVVVTCWDGHGGAVRTGAGHPRIRDCVFTNNGATSGGAVYDSSKVLELQDCVFIHNDAYSGGGVYCTRGNSSLLRCTFRGNTASASGGGMTSQPEADVELVDCSFVENRSDRDGGGMANRYAEVSLIGCTFGGNSSQRAGGAIVNGPGTTQLLGCLISANTSATISGRTGGAIYTDSGGTVALENCTIVDNLGGQANGFALYDVGDISSALHIANCIVRNGGNEILNGNESTVIHVSYTNVTDGWPGDGNIDVDPCFVSPAYWDPNGAPDNPNDDFFVEGDYHLKSKAGRWDQASGSWIQDDITSPCIDAGDPNSPLGDEPFPNGGVINMGAYGGTVEASKSYLGDVILQGTQGRAPGIQE